MHKYIELYHSVKNSKNREKLRTTTNLQIIWSFSLIELPNSWWFCFKFLLDFCVQSTGVTDAAYNVQWYNRSNKFKKMLRMFIMQAQRPSLIYLGLFPLTLEHFKNVSEIFMFFYFFI